MHSLDRTFSTVFFTALTIIFHFVASCGCATLSAPIAFSASLSHNIVQLGTQQEILFDQVHLNAGNSYDVRHGNFRAPIDGTYEFSVSMLSPGGKWAGVEIVKVK